MSHSPATKTFNFLSPFFLVMLFVVVVAFAFVFALNNTSPTNVQGSSNNPSNQLTITPDFITVGDVSMKQGVKKLSFSITNNTQKNINLTDLETSCMCTTAIFKSADGKLSPRFGMPGHGVKPRGWEYTLEPNETGKLTVEFDPNAHGPNALGPVTRYINIFTSDRTQRVGFSANVVK